MHKDLYGLNGIKQAARFPNFSLFDRLSHRAVGAHHFCRLSKMVSFENYPEILSDDESSDYDESECNPESNVDASEYEGLQSNQSDVVDKVLNVKPINVSIIDANPDLGVSDITIPQFKNLNMEARTVSMTIANERSEWHERGLQNAERKLLMLMSGGEGLNWGTKADTDPIPSLKFSRTVVPTSPSTTVKKNRWHALAPEDSQNKCANICEQLGIGVLQPQSPLIRPKKKISVLPDIDIADLSLTKPINLKATGDSSFVEANVVLADGYELDDCNGHEAEGGEWITVSNKEKDHNKAGNFGRGFGKPSFSERRHDGDNVKVNPRGGFSKPGGFSPYGGFNKSSGTGNSGTGMGGFSKPSNSLFNRSFDSSPGSPMPKRSPNFHSKGSSGMNGFTKNSGPRGFGGGVGINGGFGAGIGTNGPHSPAPKIPKMSGFGSGFGSGITASAPTGQSAFGKGFGGGFANPTASSGFSSPTWTVPEKPASQVEIKWGEYDSKPTEQKLTSKQVADGWDEWNSTAAAGDVGRDKQSWDNWDA
ncbi:hypothetical protein QR680_010620 [Steinernema hermaphroditum]|uniref:Uncharacterized protein n=1 Tax=Steinernema hermaphroditum TaxID=289476 RepID=A0AA39IS13_9BILA|nr:hypothetical protein QR680_010620 [Steinernema hermaphroditum]